MQMIKLNNKHHNLLLSIFALIALISIIFFLAIPRLFSVEKPIPILLSPADFAATQGYKLGYDIYLPNSFTGWLPNESNKLTYDPLQQLYVIEGVNISTPPVDHWGARFKITTLDWQNELGLAFIDATNEQSKFGIGPNGVVLNLKHYVDSRDIYFELPATVKTNELKLNIKVKITSQDYHPDALMYVEYAHAPN